MSLKTHFKKIGTSKVLIVEPNSYHGELLPGFTYLFQKLGFRVEILSTYDVHKENPFCKYPMELIPKFHFGDENYIKDFLEENSKRYYLLFFSTNVLWQGKETDASIIKKLGFVPSGKKGSLYIEHNLTYLDKDDASIFLKEGRLFSLLPYSYKNIKTKMINPNSFGNIHIKENQNSTKRILIIGSSSRDTNNLEYLYESVRKILNKRNFEITIIGTVADIPKDLNKVIKSTGRLDFCEYYNLLEKSDFLLTLIDLNSQDIIHTKYLNGTTSGTVQVSIGFKKPMIIDGPHAAAYGFTNNESITYEVGRLESALIRATELTDKEYSMLTHQLIEKSRNIEKESLNNLRSAIHSLEKAAFKKIQQADNDSLSLAFEGELNDRIIG
jgi:hypothetical protein